MARPERLYEVYAKGDASFGIALDGDAYVLAQKSAKGSTITSLAAVACMQMLAKKLKTGYVRQGRAMYFSRESGSFSNHHPDLGPSGDWVLAAEPGDLDAAAKTVQQHMSSLPAAVIFPEEVNLWGSRQKQQGAYLIATMQHCGFAVALAQMAYEKGWPMRSSERVKGLPDTPPSMSPKVWVAWLSNVYPPSDVQSTMRAFGYTVENNISLAVGDQSVDCNLAALL